MRLSAIGHIETPYPTKFGVPRQPGLAGDIDCALVVDAASCCARACAAAVPGSYLWALWPFSRNERAVQARFSPTVRPPALGGTRRVGVFATRSSFRPNSLALSALLVAEGARREGDALRIAVRGADAVDGTPVLAVFPYRVALDAHPEASSGWVARHEWQTLEVAPVPVSELERVPGHLQAGLFQMLAQDPRPAYTRDTQRQREFWVPFAQTAVFFTVEGRVLSVTRIEELSDEELSELRDTGTLVRLGKGR